METGRREAIEVRGNGIGSRVPDGWYTVGQAATKVGRTPDRLTAWRRSDLFVPSGWMRAGTTRVYLYNDADIEAMKVLVKTLGPGRPSGKKSR